MACAVTTVKLSIVSPIVAPVPFIVFLLDRWMIWESNKFEHIDDIPLFTKLTMIMPSIWIWGMLFYVVIKQT